MYWVIVTEMSRAQGGHCPLPSVISCPRKKGKAVLSIFFGMKRNNQLYLVMLPAFKTVLGRGNPAEKLINFN